MSHEKEQKRLNQRRRACLDKEVTHVRCDEWFGDVVTENPVTVIGYPADLHGTVCTCCPRRGQPSPVPTGSGPVASPATAARQAVPASSENPVVQIGETRQVTS